MNSLTQSRTTPRIVTAISKVFPSITISQVREWHKLTNGVLAEKLLAGYKVRLPEHFGEICIAQKQANNIFKDTVTEDGEIKRILISKKPWFTTTAENKVWLMWFQSSSRVANRLYYKIYMYLPFYMKALRKANENTSMGEVFHTKQYKKKVDHEQIKRENELDQH